MRLPRSSLAPTRRSTFSVRSTRSTREVERLQTPRRRPNSTTPAVAARHRARSDHRGEPARGGGRSSGSVGRVEAACGDDGSCRVRETVPRPRGQCRHDTLTSRPGSSSRRSCASAPTCWPISGTTYSPCRSRCRCSSLEEAARRVCLSNRIPTCSSARDARSRQRYEHITTPRRPYLGPVRLILADDLRLNHATNQRNRWTVLNGWTRRSPLVVYAVSRQPHDGVEGSACPASREPVADEPAAIAGSRVTLTGRR